MFFKSAIAAASVFACLAAASTAIEGSYIIKLKDNVATDKHLSWVGGVHARSNDKDAFAGVEREYQGAAFTGYAGQFNKQTIEEIKNSSEVAYVEMDQIWHLDGVMERREPTTQNAAAWGLAALSSRRPGATGYTYDTAAGEGTFGYIVDSGVRTTHRDFQGRASLGWTGFPGDNEDSIGHGTHVAGTVGSATYGVAKKASLISVKVFQGASSTTSIVLAGFNWAVNDIISKNRQNKAVINLSLAGPPSEAWSDAIQNAFSRGVLSVAGAGNDQVDAGGVSPASAPNAITVGAVDKDWRIPTNWDNGGGSNYGTVLDLFAPGEHIESTGNESDTDVFVISGTSMACPHVAGLALYAMSVHGIRGPKAVTDHIINNTGKGVVAGPLRGSPNRMANNGAAQ